MSTRNERRLAKKQARRQAHANLAVRSCGSCRACCTALGVAEIGKAPGVACSHLCDKGCAIYDVRPRSCRSFNCLWRYGIVDIEGRPDKIGIVFDVTSRGDAMVLRQVRPGAFEDAQEMLDRLVLDAEQVLILIDDVNGTRRMIGPKSKVAAYKVVELDGTRGP